MKTPVIFCPSTDTIPALSRASLQAEPTNQLPAATSSKCKRSKFTYAVSRALVCFRVWCMQVAALHVYNEAEEHRRIYLPSMDRFCHFNRSMRKSVTIPLCRKWKEVVTSKGFFRIATFSPQVLGIGAICVGIWQLIYAENFVLLVGIKV